MLTQEYQPSAYPVKDAGTSLHYITKSGFVGRTRTYDAGFKSRMLGAGVFPDSTLIAPQCLISAFTHFDLFGTSPTHSVWFLSLRDCYLL